MIVGVNNTICCKTNPPEMIVEQVQECKFGNGGLGCRHISDKKLFCSKCGIWVIEKGQVPAQKQANQSPKVIQADKILLIPKDSEPDVEKILKSHYKAEMGRYEGYKLSSNEKLDLLTKEEYVERGKKCINCTEKCPIRSCMKWESILHRGTKCPKGKFQ
ncbi:MAG: hypothetical protein ABSG99_02645 [Sedimentisphaerales bacterium]